MSIGNRSMYKARVFPAEGGAFNAESGESPGAKGTVMLKG